MLISDWYKWQKGLSLELRWFVLVILIRPTMEGLYDLKNVSVFLSPLYLLGVGVPVGILLSMILRYKKLDSDAIGVVPMNLFSILIALCVVVMLVREGMEMSVVETGLKIIQLPLFYFYARRYVLSKQNLEGILITALLGALFPLSMLAYESFVNPIGLEVSRGLERAVGIYADSFNYSIYLNMSLLIMLYFYGKWAWLSWWKLIGFILLSVVFLNNLNHIASWGVAASLIILYVFSSGKRIIIMFVILVFTAPVVVQRTFDEEKIYESKLLSKEYEVLMGERALEQGFHGRITRWSYYYNLIEDANVLGVSVGIFWDLNIPVIVGHVLIPPHNDYIRIMMMSGIIGLLSFLAYLSSQILFAIRLESSDRFLVFGSVATIAVYSISSVPTIYTGLIGVLFAVMSSSFVLKRKSY